MLEPFTESLQFLALHVHTPVFEKGGILVPSLGKKVCSVLRVKWVCERGVYVFQNKWDTSQKKKLVNFKIVNIF